jgi:prepilin-type processing-associated H-X9-DG protein
MSTYTPLRPVDLYNHQPLNGTDGVPVAAYQRQHCAYGTFRPIAGTQYLFADGHATVLTSCDHCETSGIYTWRWDA